MWEKARVRCVSLLTVILYPDQKFKSRKNYTFFRARVLFTNCIFKEPYIFEDGIDKVVKDDIKTIYDTLFGSAVTTPAKYLIPTGAFVNCKISDAFDVSTIYDKVRFTNLLAAMLDT